MTAVRRYNPTRPMTWKRFVTSALLSLVVATAASADLAETKLTLREHVLKLINRDRAGYHLPPVALDLGVSAIADDYCAQQLRERTTGHFTTDGLAPYMRYSFAGGNDGISENVAAWSASYSFTERALYEMVRRSQDTMMAEMPPNDGHKKTILDPHATHVGIGFAWQGGEFRIAQEFVRRYLVWTRAFPRRARIGETVLGAGRALPGSSVEAIAVHYEPLPMPLTIAATRSIDDYSLPSRRKEYLPRLRSDYNRRENGTLEIVKREYADGRRGDFYLGEDGSFSFAVPLNEGAGIYTVVVWVRRDGAAVPVAASNVSIRVDGTLARSQQTTGTR